MKQDYRELPTGYYWYRKLYTNGPPGEWKICTVRHEDQFVDFFGEHSQPFFYRRYSDDAGVPNKYLPEFVEFGPPVDKPGNLPE